MDLSKDRKSSHSMESSRLSNISSTMPNNSQVKKMQAKLLMDFYKQNQHIKQRKYINETFDKVNYGQYEKSLTQNFVMQQQAKRNRKEQIRQNLADNYNQMIRLKQQKIKEQRQRIFQQEKKNIQMSTWGRDYRQQSLEQKKIQHQYGKQLEMHLRLQEIMKYQQRMKQRETVQKFQKQQYQQNLNYDKNQLDNFKKKQQFEKRQNQILGLKASNLINPEGLQRFKSKQLQSNDIRAIKRRQQMLYGSGLEQQLRSQTISPHPNDLLEYQNETRRSPQKQLSDANMFHSKVYNPITNPIQINYKNPNVLRMLAQHYS